MPKVPCVICREWLVDENGVKHRKRSEGEEPNCVGCLKSFEWDADALAVFTLFHLCYDPLSGGYRHLPKAGGVLDQDTETMILFESIREFYSQKRVEEWRKLSQ